MPLTTTVTVTILLAAALMWSRHCARACGHRYSPPAANTNADNPVPASSRDALANRGQNTSEGNMSEHRGLEKQISDMSEKLRTLETRVQAVDLLSLTSGGGGGSTYVRWGNGSCPQSAETVYTGVIGGALYRVSGGAANMLCLPLTPTFTSEITQPKAGRASLYGVEYETRPFSSHNLDGLCSVCRVSQGTSVMIPATNQCPEGWSREYSGFLMAGLAIRGRVSTEYICVDEGREGREESSRNNQQGLLYFTAYVCGSLPCPPFRANEIVVCVVCSK